jgi:hypothetical protein
MILRLPARSKASFPALGRLLWGEFGSFPKFDFWMTRANQTDRSCSSGRETGNECMESNECSGELDSLLSIHSLLSFLQSHCVSPRLIRSAKGRVEPAPPHRYNATYPLIWRKTHIYLWSSALPAPLRGMELIPFDRI